MLRLSTRVTQSPAPALFTRPRAHLRPISPFPSRTCRGLHTGNPGCGGPPRQQGRRVPWDSGEGPASVPPGLWEGTFHLLACLASPGTGPARGLTRSPGGTLAFTELPPGQTLCVHSMGHACQPILRKGKTLAQSHASRHHSRVAAEGVGTGAPKTSRLTERAVPARSTAEWAGQVSFTAGPRLLEAQGKIALPRAWYLQFRSCLGGLRPQRVSCH